MKPYLIHSGLTRAASAWKVAELARLQPRCLVITADVAGAALLLNDLKFFAPQLTILHYPAWDNLPFEGVSPQREVSAERIYTLASAQKLEDFLIVAPVQALLQRCLSPQIISELSFPLQIGQNIKRVRLIEQLDRAGYQSVAVVENVGEYSSRGGVVDLFPPGLVQPVRLDFLDDELEKLKLFSPETQRSVANLTALSVLPVREVFASSSEDENKKFIARIKLRAQRLEVPPRETVKALAYLKDGLHFPGEELYLPFSSQQLPAFFEFLSEDCAIILNQAGEIKEQLQYFENLITERALRFEGEHRLIPDASKLYINRSELSGFLSGHSLHALGETESDLISRSNSSKQVNDTATHSDLIAHLKAEAGTGQSFKILSNTITDWQKQGYRVGIVVGSSNRSRRIAQLLFELPELQDAVTYLTYPEWLANQRPGSTAFIQGKLSEGVVLKQQKLALLAETDIFAVSSRRTGRTSKPSLALKNLLNALAQLQPGNLVVHEDYGIGRYHGLKHLNFEGGTGDFLHIEYGDSTLYLPAHNVAKISKYIAAEGMEPLLDKLAGQKWLKTKAKVRNEIQTLAGDLINLYAARSVAQGYTFGQFSDQEQAFADTFPYDETEDQHKAIEDTLKDMANPQPMDRLICGDVGFGKTEVAVRAAFKATQAGKQVAILVPTTILVEQHSNTFRERLAGYPVRIAALSRFYSPKQNNQTMENLRNGTVDIVIGTHKLLQKSIDFKDLGLMVIDEEHRFGVKQKEYLKQLKRKVDVLTLTATPIPRTLHAALLSIRDISVITTPPNNRRVVKTYLAQRDELLIRDALMREQQRGGQSFFVHNRVDSIAGVTDALRQLCPELRFEFGHGQMSETQLEEIMHRFMNHEIDCLVSTTIIESGIDIPNANTAIIDQADMFGLAQLYQIRGRVGRSEKQAYCYFLVAPSKKLGKEAQQRLNVLSSMDSLGQGFSLAMHDLEIRGAGNLLGKEQSGQVISVGYEMYTKILREAVAELRGEQLALQDTIEPEIKLHGSAFLPEYYIPDITERLIMYQRLAVTRNAEELNDLIMEISDRFGRYGVEVDNLIELTRLRNLCRLYGIHKLERLGERLLVSFAYNAPIDAERILSLVKAAPEKFRFTANHTLSVNWKDRSEEYAQIFKDLGKLLRALVVEGA